MKRHVAVSAALVLCFTMFTGEATGQDPGLSSGLIRSSATMLSSADVATVEFALRLLSVVVGIEDLDEFRRAAVAEALEDGQLLTLLAPLAARSDATGALARGVEEKLMARLGWDLAGDAATVETYGESASRTAVRPGSPVDTFRWVRFTAAPNQGHLVEIDGCDYTKISVFRPRMEKIAEREIIDYSGTLAVSALDDEQELLARFQLTGFCVDPFEVSVSTREVAAAGLSLADRRTDAPEISPGDPHVIRIGDYNQRWVRFDAELGTAYNITTSDLRGGADSILELVDSLGVQLDRNDDDVGLASRIRFVAAISGPYYLGIEDLNGSDGEFTLHIEVMEGLNVTQSLIAGNFPGEATAFPLDSGVVSIPVEPYSFGYVYFEAARGTVLSLRSSSLINIVDLDGEVTVMLQRAQARVETTEFLDETYFVVLTSGRQILELDIYSEETVYLEIRTNPFQVPPPQ